MIRKYLPAWQQVVLTALENVPKAKNGQEAWEKLAPEEQSAVMDFLKEHCGGDRAQGVLEKTLPMAKTAGRIHPVVWVLVVIAIVALCVVLMHLTDIWGRDVVRLMWILLCIDHVCTELVLAYRKRMARIWRARVQTAYGTQLALADMRRTLDMSRWDVVSRSNVIFYAVMLVLWGINLVFLR